MSVAVLASGAGGWNGSCLSRREYTEIDNSRLLAIVAIWKLRNRSILSALYSSEAHFGTWDRFVLGTVVVD